MTEAIRTALEALRKIERWEMPASGRFWEDGSPMSYGAAFGSVGEREHIRGLVRSAIATLTAEMERPDEPDTLTDLCDALYEAGHEFWKACRREAGGGAVRWVDYADGTLIVFTRVEYRDRLLSTIGRDYSAPVVVFEQPSDDDSYSGVTAKLATPPAERPAPEPVAWMWNFEEWWRDHGQFNATYETGEGSISRRKSLMKLAWEDSRELAAPQKDQT